MRNYELLLEDCSEYYNRALNAEAEVKYLQGELDDANEILDGIEEILLNELDTETAHRIYNKIFHIK